MVLGSFQGRGVLLIWIIVGQGPAELFMDAGCLGTFSLIISFSCLSFLFSFSLSGRQADID